jgi:hypothetical protein
MWVTIGVRECAAEGCCRLWNDVLVAAMTSWLMLWRHYSAADGEVCGGGGLLSNYRAATSVASTATAEGSVAAILAVH